MNTLKNLEPKKVFEFFENLTQIPHGSGNEKKISDYLVSFAKERNLEVIQDKSLNVIIKKPATKGYENAPGVIIQGHMDMVCEKSKDSNHDFMKDPLELRVINDEFVYANQTTLGADDGIAIAFGLAILDSDTISHPAIELIATTEEETGMYGADALDVSNLKGKILLNVDAEEEGVFLVSCAGGIMVYPQIKTCWENFDGQALKLEVTGLKGGHSGMEINKQRGSANKLMGRALYTLSKSINFNIASIDGGSKHNAIPRDCQCIIKVNESDVNNVKEICRSLENDLKNEFRVEDPNVEILIHNIDKPEKQLTKDVTEKLVRFLVAVPDGVQSMSKDIEGLVESSLNIGVIETLKDKIKFTAAIRSSVRSKKFEIADRVEAICKMINENMNKDAGYPEWQYVPDSKIRDLCVKTYEELFNKEPKITALHAGLECGLFKEKMAKDVDMISFGPDLFDVHTPNEHMRIASVERYFKFLIELLKNIK